MKSIPFGIWQSTFGLASCADAGVATGLEKIPQFSLSSHGGVRYNSHSMESHAKQQELTRDVMDCIRRLVHFLRLSAREAEGKTGLSGAQLFVMQKLAEAGTLSVNDLADRTRTHQSSVSVVVQKLVTRGYVARARAKTDARRLDLTLTLKGKAILKKAPRVAQDRLIQALDNLPDYNLHALSNLLGKITEDLGIGDKPVGLLFDDSVAVKRTKPRKQVMPVV